MIEWLMSPGMDEYIYAIVSNNFITIGIIFTIAKIIAKYLIPGTKDDEMLAEFEKSFIGFKKGVKKNSNKDTEE